MLQSGSVLAIIGGSRWGLVILSILAKIDHPFDSLVIVSSANATEVKSKILALGNTSKPIYLVETMDELLANHLVRAAVVVNAARQHFETARRLIQQGIHVLIEKPIVLSLSQMQTLIADALKYQVCIVPGLNYRFCSYIKNFSTAMFSKGTPTNFIFNWFDTNTEMRYGQMKRHDSSISVVQDVMPHIWTILTVIFQDQSIEIHDCSNLGDKTILHLSIKNINGIVTLSRAQPKRERYLELQFDQGPLILDFSTEPGVIVDNNKSFSADPIWDQRPTPLTQQLSYFFSLLEQRKSRLEDIECCLSSVRCLGDDEMIDVEVNI